LEGTERVVGAILVGLEHMRAEPLGQLIAGQIRPDRDSGAVSGSPLVAKIAAGMIGHSDPLAAQWLFRITFSLWYWPLKDRHAEEALVRRFAAPSVTHGLNAAGHLFYSAIPRAPPMQTYFPRVSFSAKAWYVHPCAATD